MVGASCFVLGAFPPYAIAFSTAAALTTFAVGAVFFTSASFCQLIQAQSPELAVGTATSDGRGRLVLRPRATKDRNWLSAATQFPGTLYFNVTTVAALATGLSVAEQDRRIWRPDFIGSCLFLAASAFALAALGTLWRQWHWRRLDWRIAWLNMAGSMAFMASALASFVLPSTGSAISVAWSNAGTLVGAVCFFIGAALMIPAWNSAASAGSRES
jgi:hypothetical protein